MAPNRKLPEPKPGDLIEIFCYLEIYPASFSYQHWAVYVGDGYVVHVTNIEKSTGNSGVNLAGSSSGLCDEAVVKKELLSKVVEGYKYRINNKFDGKRRVRPSKEIVQMALARVGKKWSYNVIRSNCEHFVMELRYGEAICEQVESKIWSVLGFVAGALAILGTVISRR